mmetsp:Transcript_22934/g.54402  ORF Transcript_22934/g.54402 Transcript_22934/m.54402 type:complete len:201 (+) Transcript_22934:470-1072(+)
MSPTGGCPFKISVGRDISAPFAIATISKSRRLANGRPSCTMQLRSIPTLSSGSRTWPWRTMAWSTSLRASFFLPLTTSLASVHRVAEMTASSLPKINIGAEIAPIPPSATWRRPDSAGTMIAASNHHPILFAPTSINQWPAVIKSANMIIYVSLLVPAIMNFSALEKIFRRQDAPFQIQLRHAPKRVSLWNAGTTTRASI